VIVGILAGTLALVPEQAAIAAEAPPAGLEDLWEEYPLAPDETVERTPPAVPAIPAPTPPAATPPRADDDGRSLPTAVLPLGLAVAALAAGLAVAHRRRRTVSAWRIPATPQELLDYARELAKEAAECDMVALQRTGGNTGMTETVDQGGVMPATAQARRPTGSYADFGERVAGVLSAAEAAAEHIRADARREAQDMLAVAEVGAAEVRGKAEAYDRDTRSVVDSYATERRREAEQEVQQQLADAEAQARATRQAAEAMARQIEEAGWKRGQALRDESKVVEERLKKALGGLRRMVTELEELVGAGAPEPESLADALRAGVPRADGSPAATPRRDPA